MRALALGLLLAVPAAAQVLPLRHLGSADGVSGLDRVALAPNGDLWMASASGLLRYDGVRTTAEPLPEADGPAYEVAASVSGDVWAWAPPGLYRASDGLPFSRVPVSRSLERVLDRSPAESIGIVPLPHGGAAVFSLTGGLWVGGTDGWRHVLEEPVRDVSPGTDGALWVLTRDRLGRLVDRPEAEVAWDPRPVRYGRHVRPHPDGAWVLTGTGLFVYRHDGTRTTVLDETHRCWFGDPDVAPDGTLALTVEAADLATYLVAPDGTLRQRLDVASGLRSTRVMALAFDREGGLFLASEVGLSYLEDAGTVTLFPLGARDGLSDFVVSPADGSLWMTTYGGAVYTHDGDALRAIRAASDDGRGAGYLFAGADGAVSWNEWIPQTSWAGFSSRDGAVLTRTDSRMPRAELNGRTLFQRAPPEVGVTWDDGTLLSTDAPLVRAVTGPPPSRRVWLDLDATLASLEGDRLAADAPGTPESVRAILARYGDRQVRGLDVDGRGRVWVSTRQGLLCLREIGPDVWEAREIGPEQGVPARGLDGLDVAGDRLWLGTPDGLLGFRILGDPPRLRPLATPGLAAALPHVSVYKVAETLGALWVIPHGPPTLVRYRVGPALPSPAVRLSRVAVNDRRVRHLNGLRSDTTRLALALAPVSFRRTSDLNYEYRLVGRGDGWVRLDGDPTVRFESLPPGSYAFEARAVRVGQAPGPVLSIPLRLVPPFYRAGWFLALCALGLVGLVAGGAWRHARQGARQREELERTVIVRTEALAASLATVEAQAEALQRMDEARSRLFQNVSHELRTPLTLLLGPLQDATFGLTDPDTLARQLPGMERNARRLHRLVTRLLDLARLDAGHLRLQARQTDLVPFLRLLVLTYADRAGREGLMLSFHAEPASLSAWIDRDRVEEAATNLVENALKFTTSGGKVRVTLAEARGEAVVQVRDTGRGIESDVLPHVFERFRQGADAAVHPAQGAGIGLALVREVVERHGGSVEVASEVGFGTTFSIRLPLDPARLPAEVVRVDDEVPPTAPRPPDADPDAAIPTSAPASPPTATVLVVEDNPDLRTYLREHLAPVYAVEEAADGVAGLEAARRLRPDLVISDVMMPSMDGFALCRALKADPDLGHVPVVLLTARADEASRLDGLSEGADDYLAKPFRAAELLARCENLIDVRRRLRARFSGEVVVQPSGVVVPSEEATWLAETTATVEAHLADPTFSVERLADALGMSTRALHRRMKNVSGLSPGAFIRTLRLQRAAQLLEQGAETITEVAHAVGFEDPSYFSRAFRQGFGVSPTDYAEGSKPTV